MTTSRRSFLSLLVATPLLAKLRPEALRPANALTLDDLFRLYIHPRILADFERFDRDLLSSYSECCSLKESGLGAFPAEASR